MAARRDPLGPARSGRLDGWLRLRRSHVAKDGDDPKPVAAARALVGFRRDRLRQCDRHHGCRRYGSAIARRIGAGSTVVLADVNEQALAAETSTLAADGFDVVSRVVDVSAKDSVDALAADAACSRPRITAVVHTAGVSPVQASVEAIMRVDLVGTALMLDAFGGVISAGGAGVFITSMAGTMTSFDPAFERRLATAPTDQLLECSPNSARTLSPTPEPRTGSRSAPTSSRPSRSCRVGSARRQRELHLSRRDRHPDGCGRARRSVRRDHASNDCGQWHGPDRNARRHRGCRRVSARVAMRASLPVRICWSMAESSRRCCA